MKQLYLLLSALLLPLGAAAQSERSITLSEAVSLARTQSVDAAVALDELKTAYWEYRTFRANLLPEMNLSASLPNYNKSYNAYQQSDGTYTYVRNNTLGMQGELSVDQNISLTGGRLSLVSSLDYIRQPGAGGSKRYLTVPVGIKLSQPIFAANHLKWSKRISPVRYAEAKASFIAATEEVAATAVSGFFGLLLAREALGTARQNLLNADKIYEVARAKRQIGQISENELLQLKLSALRAQAAVTESESNVNAAMFKLCSFLGLSDKEVLVPVAPESAPQGTMDYNTVLSKALERHSFALNIRRRQLEADYAVAVARGDMRSIEFFASVGYTGQNEELSAAYHNLLDNQIVRAGFKIPLLDWGKRKGRVQVARSNRNVVQSRIRQEETNFHQDIFLLVENFNNRAAQLRIAAEADQIAAKRYQTSIETFLAGKINTLDLSDAQLSKDQARQQHITELYYYWYYHHRIRSLTLWDFENRCELETDFERIVK